MRPLPEIATQVELSPAGIWTARSISRVSYPERGNDLYFAIEDQSFWFRHRNRCILELVRLFPPPGPIFDIGGGNGFVASALQQAGFEVVLVEPGPRGAGNAQRRGVQYVIQAAFEDAGFLPESLPSISLFDVVEHIEDEHGMLRSLVRVLAPGGRMYLTVPAERWLWSHEDVSAGHYRRYSLPGLTDALTRAGLEVEYASCFFGFLLIPTLLRRVLPFRLGIAAKEPTPEQVRADHVVSGVTARILEILTARELRRIAQGRVIRIGGSCLAVARKP
jgi:SAM-dependent methyltransferase